MIFSKSSKQAIVFAIGLLCSINVFADHHKETKHLQILVNPELPSFFFNMNTGTGIETNPFAIRPAGAEYLIAGIILPGGTINLDQCSYAVDKHGTPITESSSLGDWVCDGNILVTTDFEN